MIVYVIVGFGSCKLMYIPELFRNKYRLSFCQLFELHKPRKQNNGIKNLHPQVYVYECEIQFLMFIEIESSKIH